jgi:ribonuclease HI
VLISSSGLRSRYAARLAFKATNNTTEYESLILGLNKAKSLGAKTILAKTDSQIMAGQVEKEYSAREPELVKYLAMVRASVFTNIHSSKRFDHPLALMPSRRK